MNPLKIYLIMVPKDWSKEFYDRCNQNGIEFQTNPKFSDC